MRKTPLGLDSSDDGMFVLPRASDTAVLFLNPCGALVDDDARVAPRATTARIVPPSGDDCLMNLDCCCGPCLAIDALAWRVIDRVYAPIKLTVMQRATMAMYALAARLLG